MPKQVTWIDGERQVVEMTAAQISLVQPSLADQRSTASLSRLDFCKALWRAGILTPAEAAAAARGEWPATFAGFTAGMTEGDSTDAQIEWAAAATIHYAHPLLQALALSHSNGDQAAATATLDALFGVGT